MKPLTGSVVVALEKLLSYPQLRSKASSSIYNVRTIDDYKQVTMSKQDWVSPVMPLRAERVVFGVSMEKLLALSPPRSSKRRGSGNFSFASDGPTAEDNSPGM